MGLSSNLMTLGGIAFSVGMVVDASIVVAENMRRHFAENRDPAQRGFILVEAMSEVARPVSFSVLIIALVLVPLFTLQGLEGKMFAPLAMTLLVCLLVSIGVAMVIVPALSSVLLKQAEEREFKAVRRFREGYLRLLLRAMRHPKITVGAALVSPRALASTGSLHGHGVHAPAGRGFHRHQRGAPAQRLPGWVRRGRNHAGKAASEIPRSGHGGQQNGAR